MNSGSMYSGSMYSGSMYSGPSYYGGFGYDTYGGSSYDGGYGYGGYGYDMYGGSSYDGGYGYDMYGYDMYGYDMYGGDGYGDYSYGDYSYGEGSYGDGSYTGDDWSGPDGSLDCPTEFAKIHELEPSQVFTMIDKDGSGLLDEKEGFEALQCAVMAGAMTQEEAMGAFMFIGQFAGDDDKVSFDELDQAVKAMESMNEEDIETIVGAAMEEMM